jgi:methyl-accepting chemotaxis protein
MGSGEAVKALDELGLSAKELTSLTPDQMFERVAKAMSAIPNQGDRVRLAMRLFDTEGVALLNTLEAIADDGIAPLREEMKELGALSTADADAIEEMNDSWGEFRLAIQGVFNQIAATLAPVLNDLLQEILIPMAKAVIALVKGFRELIGVSPAKMAGDMDEVKKSTEAAAAASSTWAAEQKAAAEEMERLKKAEEELARSAEERAKAAESLINRLKTPIERINDEVREFARLWFEGLVPIESADRAMADFAERMAAAEEEAMKLGDRVATAKTPTIGATRAGTTEAVRVVAQLQNAQRDREAERRAEERKKLEAALRRERKLEEIRREVERHRMKEPIKVKTHKIIG